ncbi:hypothetical protein CYMTET_6156 [Cymbomonas tetramitiformis]|uniref:Uncharacterized protein n=1 Tax=Cymbomonas tetramitiformis TaxID=36881 RepID=A0AAE0LIC8_9CHLO|nr:hypothetical protein CYMTET_6156 [Cymbomonas tetramitiformis]
MRLLNAKLRAVNTHHDGMAASAGLSFQHFNVDDKDVEMTPASGGAPSFHAVSDSLAPAYVSGGELAAGGMYEEHAGMETDEEEDLRYSCPHTGGTLVHTHAVLLSTHG